MPFRTIEQPNYIVINDRLRLVRTNRNNWIKALEWYKNPEVMYYSEGVKNKVYSQEQINQMYQYLESIGELYFIETFDEQWIAIGDVTLSDKNFPIVLGNQRYWGRGFGKQVITTLLGRAVDIGLSTIYIPEIYHYNDRSRGLFTSLGFKVVKKNSKACSYKLNLKDYQLKN